MLKKKRLIEQNIDEMRKTYRNQKLLQYICIAGSFLIFFLCAKVMFNLYELIPTVSETLGFFMAQTITILFVMAGLLIAFEFIVTAMFYKTQGMITDLMMQQRINENDMNIMNQLYEKNLLFATGGKQT